MREVARDREGGFGWEHLHDAWLGTVGAVCAVVVGHDHHRMGVACLVISVDACHGLFERFSFYELSNAAEHLIERFARVG